MTRVSPQQVLSQVAAAVPESCRQYIVIIGSLAAGYHFFGNDTSRVVNTKDVDCVLEPYHVAAATGRMVWFIR